MQTSKRQSALIIICTLFALHLGCSRRGTEWRAIETGDEAELQAKIESSIPKGSDAQTAKQLLEEQGFRCGTLVGVHNNSGGTEEPSYYLCIYRFNDDSKLPWLVKVFTDDAVTTGGIEVQRESFP